MKGILNIMSAIPLFKGLPKSQLNELAEIAVEKHFGKGQTIFLEGDEGKGFFVVCSGLVKMYKVSSKGKEKILAVIKPYEIFAPVPLFSGKSYPASAEAMKPATVLFFPRSRIIHLIRSNPDIAFNMLAILANRLRQFTIQIENLSLKQIPSRLAAYFLHVSRIEGKGDNFALDISRGQLAGFLGATPETLSRIISKMQEMGIIDIKKRNIKILDIESLKNLAEGVKLF